MELLGLYVSFAVGGRCMNQALWLNLGILLVILTMGIFTANPMVLFCLLLLKDMSYGLLATPSENEEGGEYDGSRNQPMGFLNQD